MSSSDENKAFMLALMMAIHKGDESYLRKMPAGRKFLLEQALERRKIPLEIRRFPRVAAEAMVKRMDDLFMETIIKGDKNV
jgi:hypothetical protein